MTESSAFLSPPQTWHRDRYRLALVGAEAAKHRDLVSRAGYVVVVAHDGHEASAIFSKADPFDVVVLDFGLTGRPPEAVLLFSRRTSPGAPCIGLVSAEDAEQFRRAFLAGARDVLPSPARGEDLLSSVDTVLEPRALGELVEGLRHELHGAGPRAPASTSSTSFGEEAAGFRQQAMDAFAERDRAVQERASAQKKLTSLRRQIKERDQRLALMERACEELTGKLKALRDERRAFEGRAIDAERRIAVLEAALATPGTFHPEASAESAATDPAMRRRSSVQSTTGVDGSHRPHGPHSERRSPLPSDPDEEARLFELEDGDRFAVGGDHAAPSALQPKTAPGEELERVFHSYVESERRIAELRDELADPDAPAASDVADPEVGLGARAEDERRLAELDAALERKATLEKRVKQLEDELAAARSSAASTGGSDGALRRIDELEALLTERDGKLAALESARALDKRDHKAALEAAQSALIAERESGAEVRGILDAIRMERDALRRRVAELEREAADALTRIEELTPLLNDVERLRAELRATHVAARAPLPAVDARDT